jgi:hypothetical protein
METGRSLSPSYRPDIHDPQARPRGGKVPRLLWRTGSRTASAPATTSREPTTEVKRIVSLRESRSRASGNCLTLRPPGTPRGNNCAGRLLTWTTLLDRRGTWGQGRGFRHRDLSGDGRPLRGGDRHGATRVHAAGRADLSPAAQRPRLRRCRAGSQRSVTGSDVGRHAWLAVPGQQRAQGGARGQDRDRGHKTDAAAEHDCRLQPRSVGAVVNPSRTRCGA